MWSVLLGYRLPVEILTIPLGGGLHFLNKNMRSFFCLFVCFLWKHSCGIWEGNKHTLTTFTRDFLPHLWCAWVTHSHCFCNNMQVLWHSLSIWTPASLLSIHVTHWCEAIGCVALGKQLEMHALFLPKLVFFVFASGLWRVAHGVEASKPTDGEMEATTTAMVVMPTVDKRHLLF